jgi:putative membrane protein insertion efficiency factor
MSQVALALIRAYQNTASRILPHACRFQPTCSNYGLEAIKKYGFIRGGWLTTKRIIRCNPFSEGGFDPVP